jgi:hypothetical protein
MIEVVRLRWELRRFAVPGTDVKYMKFIREDLKVPTNIHDF